MKTPCANCGSIEWTRWTMTLDQELGKRTERCSDCPPEPGEESKLPNLGAGALNKNKRISKVQYDEAVKKANLTGKPVDL